MKSDIMINYDEDKLSIYLEIFFSKEVATGRYADIRDVCHGLKVRGLVTNNFRWPILNLGGPEKAKSWNISGFTKLGRLTYVASLG